jgi:hypothetical protein
MMERNKMEKIEDVIKNICDSNYKLQPMIKEAYIEKYEKILDTFYKNRDFVIENKIILENDLGKEPYNKLLLVSNQYVYRYVNDITKLRTLNLTKDETEVLHREVNW